MKPTFSCVIPTIGRKELNMKALPSILNQVEPFDEVIIVNDSPHELIICGLNNRNQIVTIRKTIGNEGGGKARMLGVMESSCDYIVFLDDDDHLDLMYLKQIKSLIIKKEPDLVFPTTIKKWTQGCIPDVRLKVITGMNDSDFIPLNQLNKIMVPTFSGLCVRRFHALKVDFNVPCFQDVYFVRKLTSVALRVHYCREAQVYFNQHFSKDRMTNSFVTRISNLSSEFSNSIFTKVEISNIARSSYFSTFRAECFNNGLLSGLNFLFANFTRLTKLSKNISFLSFWLNRASIINILVGLWLSISRTLTFLKRKNESHK